MALIGNNADTLLNGLSAFWHRFFRDIGDIQATYEGTEILLGQVYLNFLSDVLNTNIVETPLFRKEYYKLITVREDQVVFHEHGDNIPIAPPLKFYGNPGTDRYVLRKHSAASRRHLRATGHTHRGKRLQGGGVGDPIQGRSYAPSAAWVRPATSNHRYWGPVHQCHGF
jgi:hypothetical protein